MPRPEIRVLSVIYHPIYSGPHNRTSIVANLLHDHGIHSTVVLPSDALEAAERLRREDVDVVTMPLHRLRARPNPRTHAEWLRSMKSESANIARYARDNKIDVIDTNTLPNLQGGIAARMAKVACVWEIVDTFPPPAARRAFMVPVAYLADVVMTTGTKVAAAHPGVSKFGDRWINFYPCVDTSRFSPSVDVRQRARDELGIDRGSQVIGNVAAISPMKGHRTFIRAAAELRRTHANTTFVILGSTHADRDSYYRSLWEESESLGLRVGQDLRVVNPHDRVHELAQAFDVFWMTSEPRSEGIPTAIGEAKSLGIPVITTDVGSTSECVSDGLSGYVVLARDHHAIAARTRMLLDNRGRYLDFSRRARAEAIQQYAAERGADLHARAYRLAIQHRENHSRRHWRSAMLS